MFSITEIVTPSRTNENYKLKLVAALNMMQDCSEMWLESEPVFRNYFFDNNISQLLVSRQVDILRVPLLGEKMTITTSIFECIGAYGYRNTIISDEKGEPCYITWSTGAFVDHDTGRLVKIPAEITGSIALEPKYNLDYLERKINIPGDIHKELPPVEVSRNDIDYNRHMNNSQYVRIANELLPDNFDVKRLRLEYKIPAKYKDILYPRIIETDDGKIYILLLNEKEQKHCIMEFCN